MHRGDPRVGALRIEPSGLVNILGVAFRADEIKAAMAETGGVVVAQQALVSELERVRRESELNTGQRCSLITIESIPGIFFVPRHFKVHTGIPGTPTFDIKGRPSRICLYFAVRRAYRGAGVPSRSDN